VLERADYTLVADVTGASLSGMPTRAEKIRAQLLDGSFEYVQGKRKFEGAITAARQIGWSDDEIAHITGLTLGMVQTVSPPRPATHPQ
jgi:hypothetical protein